MHETHASYRCMVVTSQAPIGGWGRSVSMAYDVRDSCDHDTVPAAHGAACCCRSGWAVIRFFHQRQSGRKAAERERHVACLTRAIAIRQRRNMLKPHCADCGREG